MFGLFVLCGNDVNIPLVYVWVVRVMWKLCQIYKLMYIWVVHVLLKRFKYTCWCMFGLVVFCGSGCEYACWCMLGSFVFCIHIFICSLWNRIVCVFPSSACTKLFLVESTLLKTNHGTSQNAQKPGFQLQHNDSKLVSPLLHKTAAKCRCSGNRSWDNYFVECGPDPPI